MQREMDLTLSENKGFVIIPTFNNRNLKNEFAAVAQLAEQSPCKRSVMGSNPIGGSVANRQAGLLSNAMILTARRQLLYLWAVTQVAKGG